MSGNRVVRFFSNLKANWKRSTKEGEVLGYKEILSFSIAGSGLNGINQLFVYSSLFASTILMGSIYQISPPVLYFMASIITLVGLVKTPIISLIMDNTGKKGGKGKFKPYLLWLGIPSAMLICLIPFVPVSWVEISSFRLFGEDVSRAAFAIFILHLLISFALPVVQVAYNGLGQVITPNTLERAKVYSFQPILASFWNSVIQIIFPIFAKASFETEDMTGLENITSYRVFFPIFGIISFLILLIAYFNVEERIVVPKDYKPRVKFSHGLKSFSSNKYFWLVNIGTALLNIRAASNIVPWINVYSIGHDYATSITAILLGLALVPGMLLTGRLVKIWGKRNLMLFGGFTATILFIPQIIFPHRPYVLLTMIFCQNLAFGFTTCVAIMPADALDYQQLKTGERLEGFYGNFNQLFYGLAMLIAGIIVPIILTASGIGDEGSSVLADDAIRCLVFRNLSIFTMFVVFLSTIPYLFWDLTEEKHKEIIRQLELVAKEDQNRSKQ